MWYSCCVMNIRAIELACVRRGIRVLRVWEHALMDSWLCFLNVMTIVSCCGVRFFDTEGYTICRQQQVKCFPLRMVFWGDVSCYMFW